MTPEEVAKLPVGTRVAHKVLVGCFFYIGPGRKQHWWFEDEDGNPHGFSPQHLCPLPRSDEEIAEDLMKGLKARCCLSPSCSQVTCDEIGRLIRFALRETKGVSP